MMKKPGLILASVALATSKGHFEFDPEITGPRDIMNAIRVGVVERSNSMCPHVRFGFVTLVSHDVMGNFSKSFLVENQHLFLCIMDRYETIT